MKKLLVTAAAILLCIGAHGQGKLALTTSYWGPNGETHLIYFTTDTSRLVPADRTATADIGYCGSPPLPIAGSSLYTGLGANNTPGTIMSLAGSPTFIAALYGGTSSGSLSLQATTSIADVNDPGGVVWMNVIFANLPAGTPA